jgi:NADH dehydrogenase FAD-containing subunit
LIWILQDLVHAPWPARLRMALQAGLDSDGLCNQMVLMSRRKGIQCLRTEVTELDPEQRLLHLEGRAEPLPYDYLIVGHAPSPADLPVATLADHHDARRLRQRISGLKRHAAIAIGGEGLHSLSLAAGLQRKGRNSVWVLPPSDTWFPHLERAASARIDWAMRAHGLMIAPSPQSDLSPNAPLPERYPDLKADLWINASAAAAPAALLKAVGIDPGACLHRIPVNADLSLPHTHRIHLCGDITLCREALVRIIPPSDLISLHQARFLARLISGKIEGRESASRSLCVFQPPSNTRLARLSPFSAVGVFGRRAIHGIPAAVLHTLLEQSASYLPSEGAPKAYLSSIADFWR